VWESFNADQQARMTAAKDARKVALGGAP
jgi:hypothetical protein